MGVVEKAVAMNINDSWEAAGSFVDLYDMKTAELQKLVGKKEMKKVRAVNIDRDITDIKRLKTETSTTRDNFTAKS